MHEGKVTLWKLQVLVAGFALVLALIYWLLGPRGGFIMLIMLLPLCSVAAWLFVSERQADVLMAVLAFPFFLFMLLCLADALSRAVLGLGLHLRDKGGLILVYLYCFAGLSVGQSLARCIRKWGS
jgi:hypothetical protein